MVQKLIILCAIVTSHYCTIAGPTSGQNKKLYGTHQIFPFESFDESFCSTPSLSRYTKIEELGKGKYGLVMRVRDRCSGVEYAMKNFGDLSYTGPGSFAFEVNMMTEIGEHQNIVTFVESFVENKGGYVLMPVMQGNLYRYNKELSPEILRRTMKQILEAVSFVHLKDIVINDIKRENILLESVNPLHLRIADFGLAYKIISGNHGIRSSGTVGCLPVEKSAKKKLGSFKSDDIWAAGIVFTELAFGNSLTETANRIQKSGKLQVYAQSLGYHDDLIYGRLVGHGDVEPEYSVFENSIYRLYVGQQHEGENLEGFLEQYCKKYFETQPLDCDSIKDFARKILNRNSKERSSADNLLQHPFLLATAA